ncbi:hypothetical protein [Porphyromonas gingivalis]|uniref:VWFA domain-containing protein n=1 Tax=Porphyromonas gingivalis TaxID=837 RepID=A0AAF0BC85_PORGN|nr:hypothetical protein [Porphyromonas gingivalis]WCF98074.1 hypothetical protein NY149_05965 [Porphyromonas gingivalis]
MTKKKLLVGLLLLFGAISMTTSYAQMKDAQAKTITENSNTEFGSNHYVILVDASGSMRGNEANLKRVLANLWGKTISSNKKDFISIVPFGIDKDKQSFQNHFYLDRSILMQRNSTDVIEKFSAKIDGHFFSGNWTGLSVVNERALYLFKNTSKYVNQMFFITISDGFYNGSNPIEEVERMAKSGIRAADQVLEEINRFNKYYYIEHIESKRIGSLYLRVVKIVPTGSNNLDINSIADFPSVKDGAIDVTRSSRGYVLDYTINPKENDFEILNVDYTLKQGDAVLKTTSQKVGEPFSYTFDKESEACTLEVKFSVLYKDGIYGRLILLPENISGLQKLYYLNFEGKKNILLFFPLSDFMYKIAGGIGFSSQDAAVAFWNVVFLILVLLMAVFFVVRYIKRNKVNRDSNNVIIN